MAIIVVNNSTITVSSTESIPTTALFKTYNFFGWVESPNVVLGHSPNYAWPVRVYDTCAVAYSWLWSTFSNMSIDIDSGQGGSQTKSFTQQLNSGFDPSLDTQLSCGGASFKYALSNPTSVASQTVAALIQLTQTGTKPVSVALAVSQTSDYSLQGVYTVTLTGWFTLHPQVSFSTSFNLTIALNCLYSKFLVPPVATPSQQFYYAGQGNLVFLTTWTSDTVAINKGTPCDSYYIGRTFNETQSSKTANLNTTLTFTQSTSTAQFTFQSNQPSLGGSVLFYDVVVGSTSITSQSPSTSIRIDFLNCTQKYRDWITTAVPPQSVLYNLRVAADTSTVLARRSYYGPSLSACGVPVVQVQENSQALYWLTGTYNATTTEILINLPSKAAAVKGTYTLSGVFTNPGPFTWPLGLTITVFDSCDSSTFPSAPTLSSISTEYYIGSGDFNVTVLWSQDTVSVSSGVICGGYSIQIALLGSSTLTTSLNTAQTYTLQTDQTHFKFHSDQSSLAGSSLTYEVKIVSTQFTAFSPSAFLQVKVLACDQKEGDWITQQVPVQTFSYDVRNPPTSNLIYKRTYLGPPLSICGNPLVTFKSDSQSLSWLSFSFNSTSNEVSMLLPNKSAAVKGTYQSVIAVFSAPGSFQFPLGLTLVVFDVCDSSTFPSAPVLTLTQSYYYIGDSDIQTAVSWATDSVSAQTGISCGGYSIQTSVETGSSTLSNQIDPTSTSITQSDATHFRFRSTQSNLGGSLLVYYFKIASTQFTATSPSAFLSITLLTCDMKFQDWIIAPAQAETVRYDVRNPPSLSLLTKRTYFGPSLSLCGNPVVTLQSSGTVLSWLSYSFNSTSKEISVFLPDKSAATKNTYQVQVVFTSPGQFSWPLGLTLTVFDICDASTFPSAPVLSISQVDYFVGIGNLQVTISWSQDSVSSQTGVSCGGYFIAFQQVSPLSLVDVTQTYNQQIDQTHFNFRSDQQNLANTVLIYEVRVASSQIIQPSPAAQFQVTLLTCSQKSKDWIIKQAINFSYDVRNPPTSTLIAKVKYYGPSLVICGSPAVTFQSNDQTITFLSSTFNTISSEFSILLPATENAIKGTYDIEIVFSSPGVYSWPIGVNLTVVDKCDSSIFPSAPVLSPAQFDYYLGSGDLQVAVTWTKDSVWAQGFKCGIYSIQINYLQSASNAAAAVDNLLTSIQATDLSSFKFFTNQTSLGNSLLTYEIYIVASQVISPSPASKFTVNVLACGIKLNNWIDQNYLVTQVLYDVRNPPQSNILMKTKYLGPPLSNCGSPAVAVSGNNENLTWLTTIFNATTMELSVILPNALTAVKGVYNISLMFSSPGDYSWPIGLNLTVYDICDGSTFLSAPLLAPSQTDYYIGKGNLNVGVTWDLDSVSKTSKVTCGGYTIRSNLLMSESSIVGTLNSDQTFIQYTDQSNIQFYSNQAEIETSILVYSVQVISSQIVAASPPALFQARILTCSFVQKDWIAKNDPAITVLYDIRNPPTSNILTTFRYDGPPLDVCGTPIATLSGNGIALTWLSYQFDASSRLITVTMQNKTAAVKGNYSISVTFSSPGVHSWPVGLNISVFDICDASTFPSAPTLAPTSFNFYVAQNRSSVSVQWVQDTVSNQTGVPCGGYSIQTALSAAKSNVTATVNSSLTLTEQVDSQHFNFYTNQTNLAGSTLVYDVTIMSSQILAHSPSSQITIKILACNIKLNDWITKNTPIVNLLYDIRNPPASGTIAQMLYLGPPIANCGNPILAIRGNGTAVYFVDNSFDPATNMISIKVTDPKAAIKGNYTLVAVFSSPGVYTFPLGIKLRVGDICDYSTFPSAPVLTPSQAQYYIGSGDLNVGVTWTQDTASASMGYPCGGYQIIANLSTTTPSLTVNQTQTYNTFIDSGHFNFHSDQSELGNSVLVYKVYIVSSQIPAQSPTSNFTVSVFSCKLKSSEWIIAQSPMISVLYDLRNPPISNQVATIPYFGPNLTFCGSPVLTITSAEGFGLEFLSYSFNQQLQTISIFFTNQTAAVKGNYLLSTSFSSPGNYTWPAGINLTVYDICDQSTFPSAPTLSKSQVYYYIGDSEVQVAVNWTIDSIYNQTKIPCGTYFIQASIDTFSSTLMSSVDLALTQEIQSDSSHLKFHSIQANLAGSALVYTIRIGSTQIPTMSPSTSFQVNLLACTQMYTDWIRPTEPLQTIVYDVRYPPSSNLIASRNYLGPPLNVCGNPVGNLKANGQTVTWLTYSFDSTSLAFSVQLNNLLADKGSYLISFDFRSPGVFNFPLGLDVTIVDSCENSLFQSVPVLTPNEMYYYANAGDAQISVQWVKDSFSLQTGQDCGGYSIQSSINQTGQVGVLTQVDTNSTVLIQQDDSHVKFHSSQASLAGVTLYYDVYVTSKYIASRSPSATLKVNMLNCSMKYMDWIASPSKVTQTSYDLISPPNSNVISTFNYQGPSSEVCGPPNLTFSHNGLNLSFLTFTFDPASKMIAVLFNSPKSSDKGTYDVTANIVSPGPFSWLLGIRISIFDSCDLTVIQTGGTYSKMNFTSQSTSPTTRPLLQPTIQYVNGASLQKCGDIHYAITSSVSLSNPQINIGSDLSIITTSQKLQLQSSKVGVFNITIEVSLLLYRAVASNSSFLVEVVDCGDMSLTPVSSSQPTSINYNLFDAPYFWYFNLNGRFDLCSSDVSLGLINYDSVAQVTSIFSLTYSHLTKSVVIQVSTNDLSMLGTYQLAVALTKPLLQNITPGAFLISATISDPCNSDIWNNSDFGVIQYTLGQSNLTKVTTITNSLNATFCETQVSQILDDCQSPLSLTTSKIATASSTNKTITLNIQTEDNTWRQGQRTVKVVVQMKSPYYDRIWLATAQIVILDPCYNNSVAGISHQTLLLDQIVYFNVASTEKNSVLLNKPGWCGLISASSISCDKIEDGIGLIVGNQSAALSLDWQRSLIGLINCQVTYQTEYIGKYWLGEIFTVQISDPCKNQDSMHSNLQNAISLQVSNFTYQLCQNEAAYLPFTFIQDPLTILTGQQEFCGQPIFSFHQDETLNSQKNASLINLKFSDVLNGYGRLKLDSLLCQRGLIGTYTGWIENHFKSNDFATYRSQSFTLTITDPCKDAIFSKQQTFFQTESSPYFYLIGDQPINFNITGGYIQDSFSSTAGINYFCGYPTFNIVVKDYYTQENVPLSRRSWINLVPVNNIYSSYDSHQDIILMISTSDKIQTGIYIVQVEADAGVTLITYNASITVQVSDDPCSMVQWKDINFGLIPYTIGTVSKLTKSLSNKKNLSNCNTQLVGFQDEENTTKEWFSTASSNSSSFTLNLMLNHTNRAEFWKKAQDFSIAFQFTVKSSTSELVSFKVTGVIKFGNPCLNNSVLTQGNLSFPLDATVSFLSDQLKVADRVSSSQQIPNLCGSFTAVNVNCPLLSPQNYTVSNSLVTLQVDWRRELIGSLTCSFDYRSEYGDTYLQFGAVVWPGSSFKIELTEPCATETYLPIKFSEAQTFQLDYSICQASTSELSFDFTDALSNLSNRSEMCGTPVLGFHFSNPLLQSLKNISDFVSISYLGGKAKIVVRPQMCVRYYYSNGQTVMLNGTSELIVTINCAMCTGQPQQQAFNINFLDPCQDTNRTDSLAWYYNLPVVQSQSGLPNINIDVRQNVVVYDLTSNYTKDSISAFVGIDLFCGAPVYKLSVYDQQSQLITNQNFSNINSQSGLSTAITSYSLSLQTQSIENVGAYKLVLTTYLQPGPWFYQDYPIELTVTNPCELQFFDFSSILFDKIYYNITDQPKTVQQVFKNNRGANWCDVHVVSLLYDSVKDGPFQRVSPFASAQVIGQYLSISVYSNDTSARKTSQKFYLGLEMDNSYESESQIYKDVAEIELYDPCSFNFVLAQTSQTFFLDQNVTFIPQKAVDNLSSKVGVNQVCGEALPTYFSCKGYTQNKAYLDGYGKAFIQLDWNVASINKTLVCQFNYQSLDYNATWVGNWFNVTIMDPCLQVDNYTLRTSFNDTSFKYSLGYESVQFEIWFESLLDQKTGKFDFCGPVLTTIQSNSSTTKFQNSTFYANNNTLVVKVGSKSSSDLGFYLQEIIVSVKNFGHSVVIGSYLLEMYAQSPCDYSTLNPLMLQSQNYYLWQPPLTQMINITDDCAGCNCEWQLKFSSQPQNTSSFITFNSSSSGQFHIWSTLMSSVNSGDKKWVTLITVEFSKYPVSGSVSGYLKYSILHPCLLNIGIVTFDNALVQYDVCQNTTSDRVTFSLEDSLSKLTGTPNYCGVPNFGVVPHFTQQSSILSSFVKVTFTAQNNTGTVQFQARMCDRKFTQLTPYSFNLLLTYTNGSVSTFSRYSFNVQINDPCEYAQLPEQSLFESTFYSISTYGQTLDFNLSASYQADNVTIQSGLDYFCGSPYFEVQVYNDASKVVWSSQEQVNDKNFTSLLNPHSNPPKNSSILSFYSTDNTDYLSTIYTVIVSVGLEISTANQVNEGLAIQIIDACLSTVIDDNYQFKNVVYQVGSPALKTQFVYSIDSVSALFYQKKNISYDECGDHIVTCKVQTTQAARFFIFSRDTFINSNTYSYSIYSNSTLDVGIWQVKCEMYLLYYPLVDSVVKYFSVQIQEQKSSTTLNACSNSSDPTICQKFLNRNPPYFSSFPDSQNQFATMGAYNLDIQNIYIQYANNISISTISCDQDDLQFLSQYAEIKIITNESTLQANVGPLDSAYASDQMVKFGFYCPVDYVSTIIMLTLQLGWKGVAKSRNLYSMPVYCMPCDMNFCSINSYNYYATLSDWQNNYHSDSFYQSQTQNSTVKAVQQEPELISSTVLVSSAYVNPFSKDNPELKLPTGDGKTYLDFGFNSEVPIKLPNGQIRQVKMCAPSLLDISNTGQVTIQFSKEIDPIPKSFYEEIQASNIIQISLMLGSEVSPENAKIAQQLYAFNYTINEISQNQVLLQIRFVNPGVISTQGTNYDFVQIQFVNSGRYFKCQSSLEGINDASRQLLASQTTFSADTAIPTGYRLIFPLPAQVKSRTEAVINKVVSKASKTANAFIFVAVVIALMFEIRLDKLWGCIHALQLIACLSYGNVPWPTSTALLYDLLNKVSQFSLVDPFTKLKSDHLEGWSATDYHGSNLVRVNGGSLTFLPNLGSVALFIHLAAIWTGLLFVVKMLQKFQPFSKLKVLGAPNTDKLVNQWLRIFIETYIVLYMFLLLGFQMADQLSQNLRTPFDKWSIATQSIMIVPIFGFPVLVIWFTFYYSRWFVAYHKRKFLLSYQQKLIQDAFMSNEAGLEANVASNDPFQKVDAQRDSIEGVDAPVDQQDFSEGPAQPSNQEILQNRSEGQLEIQAENNQSLNGFDTPVKQGLIEKQVSDKQNDNQNGEILSDSPALQAEKIQELKKLQSYRKFATLHKEINQHSFTAQYYWSLFIVRRLVYLTVCVYSRDNYQQTATFIVLSMISNAFLHAIYPFELKSRNYVEILNELIVLFCALIQMVLVGYTIEGQVSQDGNQSVWSIGAATKVRQLLANFVISAVALMIITNAFATIFDLQHQSYLVFKKIYARVKVSKAVWRRHQVVPKLKASVSDIENDSSQLDQENQKSDPPLLLPNDIIEEKSDHASSSAQINNIQHLQDAQKKPENSRLVELNEEIIDIQEAVLDRFESAIVRSNTSYSDTFEASSVMSPNIACTTHLRNSQPKANLPLTTAVKHNDQDPMQNYFNAEIVAVKLQPPKRAPNKLNQRARSKTGLRGVNRSEQVNYQKVTAQTYEETKAETEERQMPLTARVKGEKKRPGTVNITYLTGDSLLKKEKPQRDLVTPRSIARGAEDQIESVSLGSEDVEYIDQTRDKLNDSSRILEKVDVVFNKNQLQEHGEQDKDSAAALEDLIFGYEGDLKSFRVLNKSKLESEDQGQESKV